MRSATINTERLVELDTLKTGDFHGTPVYLHTDHRWTLPLLRMSQENGTVPCPCKLIVFDRHHDSLAPTCLPELRTLRKSGVGVAQLIDLCQQHLRRLDDDWVKAAMELGLVDDAVVFGVERRDLSYEDCFFDDHTGDKHRIFLTGLPGNALEYQGDLSDLARLDALKDLWKIINWSPAFGNGSGFSPNQNKAYLSIDLDCFVITWGNYVFPWLEEVYLDEFIKQSTYMGDWSGKRFFHGLLQQASVIDIAREPSCCGGDAKAEKVLFDLNQHLFDGKLIFESKTKI